MCEVKTMLSRSFPPLLWISAQRSNDFLRLRGQANVMRPANFFCNEAVTKIQLVTPGSAHSPLRARCNSGFYARIARGARTSLAITVVNCWLHGSDDKHTSRASL
jgi:hypothetical protein